MTNYQPAGVQGSPWHACGFAPIAAPIGIHPSRLPRDAPPRPVLIDEISINDHVANTNGLLPRARRGRATAGVSFCCAQLRRSRAVCGCGTCWKASMPTWIETAPDRTASLRKITTRRLPAPRHRVAIAKAFGTAKGPRFALTVMPAWWQTALVFAPARCSRLPGSSHGALESGLKRVPARAFATARTRARAREGTRAHLTRHARRAWRGGVHGHQPCSSSGSAPTVRQK